jgi:hypothetical protein
LCSFLDLLGCAAGVLWCWWCGVGGFGEGCVVGADWVELSAAWCVLAVVGGGSGLVLLPGGWMFFCRKGLDCFSGSVCWGAVVMGVEPVAVVP